MINELLQVKNDQIFTTSLLVAEKFNKQHSKVMRAIENILEGIANFGDTPKLFELAYEVNEQNGVSYPMYYINRDGFTLLAMGFTGKEALAWKLKYIEAFNEMEQRLHSPNLPDKRIEIARLILQASESKLHTIRELFPEYFSTQPEPDSLEYISDINTSYRKWSEDYGINTDWITSFPTSDIYNSYMRYCTENKLPSMGKKTFYATLEIDYNFRRIQKSNGFRYFVIA